MIREQEIADIKNQNDDMIRHGKNNNVYDINTQSNQKSYDINTPSGESPQFKPDSFVKGEDSIEDLEDSPEQESYNVIQTKSVKKKMKSRNTVFEKTDQPDIHNLSEHQDD